MVETVALSCLVCSYCVCTHIFLKRFEPPDTTVLFLFSFFSKKRTRQAVSVTSFDLFQTFQNSREKQNDEKLFVDWCLLVPDE